MLNNLFRVGGGIQIYISVSPSCGLEMIELDAHGNIKSYAQVPLEYNEAQREIANYDEFKNAVETAFSMRNINPAKAQIHLSLPTVWFGAKDGLPLLLDESAITNIVLGELEQTYIFKRKDPIPYWFDNVVSKASDSRSIFYTAIQADVVSQLKDIFTAMGATVVSVGCSLFADLKALHVTGVATELMVNEASWSLMIVNNTGFHLLGMQGNRILDYYEEPLPIKSYEGEEIYNAIESAAQIALMSTAASSLVIISETDLVSAEILAGRLQFTGSTIFVEDNQFRKEPLMEMSLNILSDDQLKVSLHAIGAITPSGLLPVDVDYVAEKVAAVPEAVIEIPIGDKVYSITPKIATIAALIILALVILPLFLASLFTQDQLTKAQETSASLDAQITELDAKARSFEANTGKPEFDPIAHIENVLKNNRTKIMAYAALGESIPKNIYLTYFLTGDEGKINIKGCADSVEDVYVFFKNLKDSLVESRLRLSKLDLKTGSLDAVVNSTASTVDDAPYVFEITNMSEGELRSFMNRLMNVKEDLSNQQNQEENNENNENNKKAQAASNNVSKSTEVPMEEQAMVGVEE